MNKIGEFLNKTTEISNGNRIVAVLGILSLSAMGQVLNYKLFKERMKNIELESKNYVLKHNNEELKMELGLNNGDNQDEMFE